MSLRAVLLSSLLVAGLSACERKAEVIEAGPRDTPEVQEALAKPVELPPSIAASKQFRCTDNSLVFVDFYSDGLSASVRPTKDGAATRVVAAKAGDPMSGDGVTLKGAKGDRNVSVTLKDAKKPLSCHL